MSSGFQRSGKMAVTSFSLASDFTRLPLQRGPLEVGSDPFAWIFIKVPMQIASISSSTGPLLSVTHTHASAVGNAENSCLKGQRLPRRTGQASCQLLPPALLLTIWVLASGSCEDLLSSPLMLCGDISEAVCTLGLFPPRTSLTYRFRYLLGQNRSHGICHGQFAL